MTLDREQQLEASILRLTNENEDLKRQVRALQRDLDHATGDMVMKFAFDVSVCRRILDALNNKMGLVDDGEAEPERPHGQEDRRAPRSAR